MHSFINSSFYMICIDILIKHTSLSCTPFTLCCCQFHHHALHFATSPSLSLPPAYGTTLHSDLTSLLDLGVSKDLDVGGMYSVANSGGTLMPQMKTFYQKPSSTPISVAPYATTTLINTCGSSASGSSGLGKPGQSVSVLSSLSSLGKSSSCCWVNIKRITCSGWEWEWVGIYACGFIA